MSIAETIRDKLSVLEPESIELFDESGKHVGHQGAMGGGGHYQLIIVATAFVDQPLQKRHRMVYEALGGMMHKEIHALAIKAFAPEEI